MFNIFTEEIKNTRFILTVMAVSLLALFGVAIIAIIVYRPDVKISEGLLGLLTTILGAVIAIVSVAYNSHFKAQEQAATAREAQLASDEICDSRSVILGDTKVNRTVTVSPNAEDS